MSQTDSLSHETPILVCTSSLPNAPPAPSPDETHSTTSSSPSPSTQWALHLSVTPTHGNRKLATSSRQWKALRAEILLRDKNTCSSCGYVSPHPRGRSMIIDHADGDASNNDASNLRIHCPPCETIRHCGFAGLRRWLIVRESAMEQVEIVRKTREIFENTGVIPRPDSVDPSVKAAGIQVLELANMMLRTPWKDLPDDFHRLRGFFTRSSSGRFRDTMFNGNPDMEEPDDNSTEVALFSESDQKAAEIAAREAGLPWIQFSKELHKSSQVFLTSWPPSKTANTKVAWICVANDRAINSNSTDEDSPDLHALSTAWDKMCAEGQSTSSEVDKLAERFSLLSGKWLVFVSSDQVDSLWGRIVKATLAGTMGTSAKVSPRDEDDPKYQHVICVYNTDYRSKAEVNRIRDGLRRLGVKERIGYKPDIYTHCRIYQGNSWGIPPSRYHS